MTKYTIVTDEVQRVLNDISDQAFRLRSDFQHVEDDIKVLLDNICGWYERNDQTYNGEALDQAINRYYYDEVDPYFDDLATELGRLGLAMQDVLNYFVSGDAEMSYRAYGSEQDFPVELTTSGQGDPPPSFDTREMWEGKDTTRELGSNVSQTFNDAYWNHNQY